MCYKKLSDVNVKDKRVLIRVDMNIPLKDGKVTEDTRIQAAIPTIQYCLAEGASVILMTHLGRPKEGFYSEDESVMPIAQHVSHLLDRSVPVLKNWQNETPNLNFGEVAILENVRFNLGEKANSDELGKSYAHLCDVFINDAFGTAHRTQASIHSVAKYAPISCAGLLLDSELQFLEKALKNPVKPMVAIVGGSKVSTKLTVLKNLAEKVDTLIVGGGIANTFLLAKGLTVGNSLVEESLLDDARQIIELIEAKGGQVPLPSDVVVAKEFSEHAVATLKKVDQLESDDCIFDIGPDSIKKLKTILETAGTIVWNGPVGVFEFASFSKGTEEIAQAIAKSQAFSIAGGGDTLAAISSFGIADGIDYVSTGGGAFLEFLEGKLLPAVEVLSIH